jgi:hypothetical protein
MMKRTYFEIEPDELLYDLLSWDLPGHEKKRRQARSASHRRQ